MILDVFNLYDQVFLGLRDGVGILERQYANRHLNDDAKILSSLEIVNEEQITVKNVYFVMKTNDVEYRVYFRTLHLCFMQRSEKLATVFDQHKTLMYGRHKLI